MNSNTQLAQALRSTNAHVLKQSLEKVRVEGQTPLLIEIFDLMLRQKEGEIYDLCCALLNDLKTQEAADQLAMALGQEEYLSIQKDLVAACWQNGLSYAAHVEAFAKLALEGSYETAIEAFTVLEEAAGELELSQRDALAEKLRHGLLDCPEDKKALLMELVKIVDHFEEPGNLRLDPGD